MSDSALIEKITHLKAQLAEAKRERDEARDWVRKMHRESQTLTCVYCGHAYPPGTPSSGSPVLTAHIEVCPKHPMKAVRDKLAAAEAALERAREALEAANDAAEYCDEPPGWILKVRAALSAPAAEPACECTVWRGCKDKYNGCRGNPHSPDCTSPALPGRPAERKDG